MTSVELFNTGQLATYEQARAQRDFLNAAGMGILPFDDEKAKDGKVLVPGLFDWLPPREVTPGIHRLDWQPGPSSFVEPNYTDPKTGEKYFFLHFRLQNGADGLNVGLSVDKMRRYPTARAFAIAELLKEAASMARGAA